MSARSIPRISRNLYRSGRVFAESFMQPQRQKVMFNGLKNMQFRHATEFSEAPVYKAMAKLNRMNRLSRVELGRIQVILATSLVSKTAAVSQMIEEMLKTFSTNEEEDEGSGSRVFPFDDV